MKYNENERFLIALCSFSQLEYKHRLAIYEQVKDLSYKEKVEYALRYAQELYDQNTYNSIKNSFEINYIEYVINELEGNQVTAVTIDSDAYPESLMGIENPPLVLYSMGDISLLSGRLFSIVGSRKSLPLSINLTEDYAKGLVDGGLTLVTGIAEGVDVTVIKTALKNNGRVISVLAGGLKNVYPKAHESIVKEVAEKGLVISENGLFSQALPFMFPIRNRIIAGLSMGTLVVNGSLKSGTLYTAEYAMENGRDLFAIPYSVGVKSGEGNNELIKRGASLTDKPSDILDYYGIKLETIKQTKISDEEQKIIEAIEQGVCHVEEISVITGIEFEKVCADLAFMEIKKLVVKDGINEYSLVR